MSVWDETDERVLRWVHEGWEPTLRRQFYSFETSPTEPIPELDGMSSDRLDGSLQRLLEHGLIDGERAPFLGGKVRWAKLRPTANGLIVLGEWPDLDLLVSSAGIAAVLDALAEGAPESERRPLRRAAGAAERMSGDLLRQVIEDAAGAAGEDIAP